MSYNLCLYVIIFISNWDTFKQSWKEIGQNSRKSVEVVVGSKEA